MRWAQLFAQARDLLNDNEADPALQRWTDRTLASFTAQAINVTLWIRPDRFGVRRRLALAPGSQQTLPDDCKFFTSGAHNMDANGAITTPLFKTKYQDSQRFYDSGCIPCKKARLYRATEFSKDPLDPRTIYIKPPLPEGISASLSIICATPPDPAKCDEEMPIAWEQFFSGLLDYIVARAYLQDTESASSQRLAQSYRQDYATRLGVRVKDVDKAEKEA